MSYCRLGAGPGIARRPGAVALLIRGRAERQGAVVNIVAERLEALLVGSSAMSRDFR
ncbi:MAG: hypothetical protein R2706_01330 [Acidimicrobiales bacterium]